MDSFEQGRRDLRIAERYLHGDLALHMHGRLRRGPDGKDLCAVVQKARSRSVVNDGVAALDRDLHDFLGVEDGNGGVQVSVLVRVREVGKPGERSFGQGVYVPSRVRLQLLDKGCVVGGDTTEHPGEPTGTGRLTGLGVDGELVPTPRHSVVGEDELPDKVVERASGQVEELADEQAPRLVGRLRDVDTDDEPLALLFRITGDRMEVSVVVREDLWFEQIQLFFRPVELATDVDQ